VLAIDGFNEAEAIRKTLSENLRGGKRPDGGTMPGIAEATRVSRDKLESAFRGTPSSTMVADYRAPRVKGGPWTPKAGGPRGVVSGLLAASIAVRPGKDGKSFIVFVAATRGTTTPQDPVSAVERVFRDVPVWSQAGMAQPEIRDAMRAAADSLLGRSIQDLASSAGKLLASIEELSEEGEE
jgi:hypothetical protein